MNFAAKLALRELKRNKVKLIIAIVIALIMFVSAFLLVNLANALPDNFYAFYKDNYAEDMVVNISNADAKLVEKADTFFDNIKLNYQHINEKFYVGNGSNNPEFSYMQTDADGGIDTWKYYKADYCDVGVIPDKIKKLGDSFLLKGSLWDKPSDMYSIWVADVVAERINATIGSKISVVLELSNREPNFAATDFYIAGIYDYALASQKDANFPVFYTRSDYSQIMYLTLYDRYSMSGQVKEIDKFYAVYNELNKSYDLSENVVIDMIITVKNSEIICYIIGGAMLLGGMVILLNFIAMLISTNRKNIGVMISLGAKGRHISTGYGLIFAGLIAIVTIIALCLLPTMNALITLYCATIGYTFVIKVNWLLLLGLYLICNINMIIIMWVDKLIIEHSSPIELLNEED